MEHKRAIMVALTALVAPLSAQAQDSDGDGVPDSSDAFPCDPSRASVSYFPGDSTSALLAFEDEWPHHTDLDFNDVVVRAHYRMERDAAGNVVSLHGVYDPVAVGGDFSNGLALQLPVSRTGVTARRRIAGGAWEALTLESDGQATMVLSPNLRELFGNASGRINSIPGQPQLPGQRLELEVTFAAPAALSVATAPFDVFIFRSGDFGHQIHFPQYSGTSAMHTGLFGSSQDGSTTTRRFVHQSGIPAALNLMTSTRYPLEGAAVSSLFPDIVSFAASAGATHATFYASNVVTSQGREVSAPAVPGLAEVDRACIPVGPPAGFVVVPAGSFMMSSPTTELGRIDWREEQVWVTLTRPFHLGATEVTQGEWKALSGGLNPSCFQRPGSTSCSSSDANDMAPVEQVTWWSALGYLNALSASQGLSACYTLPSGCSGSWQAGTLDCAGNPAVNASSVYECTGYRLPTEAEWEYAARAGTTTATYNGDLTATSCSDTTLPSIAWFCGNSGSRTRPVAGLTSNALGLYDMLGNVMEWVWDWFDQSLVGGTDPGGPSSGSARGLRGGNWAGEAWANRAAYRNLTTPSSRFTVGGFRAARTAP